MSELYLKIDTKTKVGKIFSDLAESLKNSKGLSIAEFEDIEELAIANMIQDGMTSGVGDKKRVLKKLSIK